MLYFSLSRIDGSLTESLDVSKNDSGIYFLRVKTQNGEVDQRFIKD
ncbi:MAG: hypothetical protein COA38_13045 [Fluviicola sp.]|nr:MAG: hypothetical protein COA38_13045 [Fluviicola sp.]